MPLFDFTCSEGHAFEKLAPFGVETVACACGAAARRAEVNRIMFAMPAPRGEKVAHYYEAASEARDAYERTDDPAQKAATRPDVWRPAWYRSRNKLQAKQIIGAESDYWADPNPGKSEKQALREEVA